MVSVCLRVHPDLMASLTTCLSRPGAGAAIAEPLAAYAGRFPQSHRMCDAPGTSWALGVT